MSNLLSAVNNSNLSYLKRLYDNLNISYDGLNCPICDERTVSTIGHIWCPKTSCDWGNPPQINSLTKFS